MQSVAHILSKKRHAGVITIAPTSTVLEALQLMSEKSIGAVIVTEGEQLAGILSERDCVRKVELQGRSAATTQVAHIMTADVLVVTPEQDTNACMGLMTERRLRHLPVVDNGRLIGLVSIGDLVAEIMSEQEFTINQLQNYIQGDSAAM